MSDATRRTFLAAAGTGAAATAAVVAAPAAFAATPGASPGSDPSAERLVAYVEDAAAGRLTIMWGEDEVTISDPALVRRLTRAVRS